MLFMLKIYLVLMSVFAIGIFIVKPKATMINDCQIAHYGKAIKLFLITCLILGSHLFIDMVSMRISDFFPALLIFIIFAAIAIPGLLETFLHKVKVSENGLQIYSAWHKTRIVSWKDIKSITYIPSFMWFVFDTEDYAEKIKLSYFLYGISEIVTIASSRNINVKMAGSRKN